MKNLKKKFRFRINLKSKHLLAIMTLFCLSCIVATFASGISTAPLQETAGIVIVPFEKSIEKIGSMVRSVRDSFKDKQDLLFENEELKAELDSLTTQNNKLIQDQGEYQRLKELYNLDQTYEDYPKVAATIISKDPGNWYDTFMINKGSDDGIRVDNNVIAGKGLVGIVTEVGSSWATVRSIIDDSSSVSAMTVSTSDNCIVNGDLELIDEGKLRFEQLYDQENKVTVGERIVTSNISEKFVEGLFIGYVSEVQVDSNNLTKTGTIVTPVDFLHLKDVFVITVNKQDLVDGTAQVEGNSDSGSSDSTSGDSSLRRVATILTAVQQTDRRAQMKGKIVYFLTIVICFLLQCTVMDLISIGSVTPNLMLVFCVSMGLMRGRKSGLWAGFFSGLFVDLFFGSVFGFYALIYMYIGYLSGYAHRIYYDDDVKVPMFLTAIADLLYNLSVYGLQFLLRGRLGLGTYLYRIIIPEMFYTVFITLIVYRIFRYINYHYMNITRKESESIWVLK